MFPEPVSQLPRSNNVVRPHQSGSSSLDLNGILPVLQRLDQRLSSAISAERNSEGTVQISTDDRAKTAIDPYRGVLQPELAEVEQLLSREPGTPEFATADAALSADFLDHIPKDSAIAWLQQTFDLSAFDLELMVIALAPAIDRRYEQLYAYLQDDVRCKRPTVDLALNLLCASPTEKLTRRVHFTTNGALIRHRLLHLVEDEDKSKRSLLTHDLQLDEPIIQFLLGQMGLSPRLMPYSQQIQPTLSLDALWLKSDIKRGLAQLTQQCWQNGQLLRLYFQGMDRTAKQQTAEALAAHAQALLLVVDLAQLVETKVDFEDTLRTIARTAWFQQNWLYLENLDALLGEAQSTSYQFLLETLRHPPGIVILSGVQSWVPTTREPLGVITLPFPIPNFEQRRNCWQTHLTAAGITLSNSDLDALSDRFRLTSDQITNAVAIAVNQVQWQAVSSSRSAPALLPLLFAAARTQSSHALEALARKIEPRYSWDDIVLSAEYRVQLQEIANQARDRLVVYQEWGFDRKLSLGKGITALFSGSPGTGKTMAAEVIANVLQLDLYQIDLSQVVSKYIGETEKNLNRIFTAADQSNAILLFDEADALFGKRSEVKDAHDRYANIETSYLLQKMEEYDGLAILTTNLRSNMDEAFVRRLRFIIDFPVPSARERRQIWEKVWTPETPMDSDLDLEFLAGQFEITGANIRNIALTAAFLAASDGRVVRMVHLLQAVRREYQKMGKILMADEFGDYTGLF